MEVVVESSGVAHARNAPFSGPLGASGIPESVTKIEAAMREMMQSMADGWDMFVYFHMFAFFSEIIWMPLARLIGGVVVGCFSGMIWDRYRFIESLFMDLEGQRKDITSCGPCE